MFSEGGFESGDKAVDVAGTEGEDDIGAEGRNKLEGLVGGAEILGHGVHLAKHHGRGDAENGFLAGGINGEHDDLVEGLEDSGEIVGEVAGAGVEVRLEDAYDTLAGIEKTDGFKGTLDFLRMVGIVVDVNEVFLTDAIVEAAAYAGKGLETMAQLELVEATRESHSGGDDSILDIDEWGTVEFKVIEDSVGSAEVEEEVAIIIADIDGVVVGLDATSGVGRR